jgi:hypothetical protein
VRPEPKIGDLVVAKSGPRKGDTGLVLGFCTKYRDPWALVQWPNEEPSEHNFYVLKRILRVISGS